MRIYISGPMTGLPEFNQPAFFKAEDLLVSAGHTPLNPARSPKGLEYRHYMDIAFAMVRSAEAVFCLPGWENSKGATAEIAYAESLGLKVYKDIVPYCAAPAKGEKSYGRSS
ncbi:MAG: DUF4406 domain-containing protein [Proteobacteria bacterium]|nr:DUF4406 domain-containing protein [Pseudomonadota bacterium]